ncbi:MAG TPA: hypothetical protein VNW90_15265, partial [Acetobacteraceae bacterium]|nr:hypothetical protein [Acetobacteraceae bacterium]
LAASTVAAARATGSACASQRQPALFKRLPWVRRAIFAADGFGPTAAVYQALEPRTMGKTGLAVPTVSTAFLGPH